MEATLIRPAPEIALLPGATAVYADGGVIQRNPSPLGGTWAYCWVSTAGEHEIIFGVSGIVLPGNAEANEVSNNVSEYFALAKALRHLPDGWSGQVYSDSQITLGRFFWGWKNEKIPAGWVVHVKRNLARLGTLEPVLLDGHPTKAQLACGIGKRGNPVSRFNCWCDEQCRRQAAEFLKEKTCQRQA